MLPSIRLLTSERHQNVIVGRDCKGHSTFQEKKDGYSLWNPPSNLVTTTIRWSEERNGSCSDTYVAASKEQRGKQYILPEVVCCCFVIEHRGMDWGNWNFFVYEPSQISLPEFLLQQNNMTCTTHPLNAPSPET